MQNSYRAFDSTSELAFRGPWPFCLLGVATDPGRNLGAKSGAWSAESLASPEAVEPGSGVFRRQDLWFTAIDDGRNGLCDIVTTPVAHD
jgi:hypothetical protein